MGVPLHEWVWLISGLSAVFACTVSFWIIYNHLLSYEEPHLQKYIVRILIMIPVYTIDSFLSLVFKDHALYFDVARDCYEAWVLYMFFRLLVEFLGGEDRIRAILEEKPPVAHPFPFCWIFSKPSSIFYHRCKQLILQFVLVKPLLAIILFVLETNGLYGEGKFDFEKGYIYITFVYNISIFCAMYCLVLFYETLHDELKPFRPLSKFLCIKAVIFFAFWQGVAISVLAHYGLLKAAEGYTLSNVSTGAQDMLVCIEMVPLSLCYAYAFGSYSYKDPRAEVMFDELKDLSQLPSHIRKLPENVMPLVRNLVDVANPRDAVNDTFESFAEAPKRLVIVGDFLEIPMEQQLTRIERQGWLGKRAGLLKGYQQRYFLLLKKPKGMLYFAQCPFERKQSPVPVPNSEDNTVLLKNESFDKPFGFVDFTAVTEIRWSDVRRDTFELVTPVRVWSVRASAIQEAEDWMAAVVTVWQQIQHENMRVTAFDEDDNDSEMTQV